MADDAKRKTTRIGGFELLERLGQGGMGTVYRARQVSMDRVVALKILPPKLAKDKAFVQRFIREARAAASLQHPNIVQGIDVGVADGYYYFAMELVDGPTIKQLIQRDGKLEEKRALEIVRGIALALGHAHEQGIIHRDVKPENLMLTAKGEPKLADLGLARRVEDAGSVTLEGTALGTPYYMAPEQVRGLPDIDTRADIYALGATLFHMVTGAVPFDGPSASAIMTRQVTDPPPSARTANPNLSRACDELIQRMMAKDPADRPQTPAELLSDIDDALAGRVHLRPSPRTKTRALAGAPKHRRPRPTPADVGGASLPRVLPKRRVGPWVFAGAGILVLAVVLIWLATRGGGPPKPTTDPAQVALRQADAWAKSHPDDHDGAIARYQAIASQHGGSQWAATAAGRVEELRKRRAAATTQAQASKGLEAAIAKLTATARDLAAKDRFGDALKAIDAFAAARKEPSAADAAGALKRDVLASAGARFDTLADAADDAKGQGDYAKARATLEPVLAFGIPDLADAAKRKLARYGAEEKNAEHLAKWDTIKAKAAKPAQEGKFGEALKLLETAKAIPLDDMADRIADEVAAVEDARQAKLDAALAAYRPESDKVWAAFKERDYATADRLLADLAKRPEFTVGGVSTPRETDPAAWRHAAHNMLAADQQAAGLLKAFWAAVEEGLKLRVGQFLAFGGEGGTIAAVRNGQVTLKTPKGEATLPIAKLGTKQALMYALLKDDPRSHLIRGVYLLAEQAELDEAQQALASAGDAQHAAAYRDRLDALRLGADEHAARRAWARIEAVAKHKLSRTQIARLGELLGEFEKEHGQSKARREVAEQLTALRARVARAAEPVVYTEWPFDAQEARRRQAETARAIGVPVEQDIDLGGGVKVTLVLIPAGEFLMGSPPTTSPEKLQKTYGGEPGWYRGEFPQHRVTISKPFWLGKTQVTQAQWQAVMGDNPSTVGRGPQNPVEHVSWEDCQAFVQKLSAKLRRPVRLPTEAEWEYACRAGAASEFHFGDSAAALPQHAWFDDNSAGSPHPVGKTRPNTWGLHDTAGNLWEWCEDWIAPYDQAPQVDPRGPDTGGQRVLRGGPWNRSAACCRSAFRHSTTPTDRGARLDLGCRVCIVAVRRLAPEAEPRGEAPKAGEWQSLFDGKSLRGWREIEGGKYQGHGRVSVEDGRILLERGAYRTGITWTDAFPTGDYELTLEAMRSAGENDFCIAVFPIGDRMTSFGMGRAGNIIGLNVTEGPTAKGKMVSRQVAFQTGRWYRVGLRVTRAKVELWLDGKKLFDLDRRRYTFRALDGTPPGTLSLVSYISTAAYRNIRLRRLAPEAEPRGEAPKAGGWRSLFDGKTLRGWRKSTRGKFARPGAVLVEDGAIVVGGGRPWTAVVCTQKLPTLDYELELEARRVNGLEDFCDMLFPVGTGYGRLMAGGDGGGRLAVSVKTPVAEGEGTVRTWRRFHSDRWYRLRLRVSRARFEVFVDDQRLLDAPTASTGVELRDGYEDLVPLGIFTWNTRSHVRNIRFRRLP